MRKLMWLSIDEVLHLFVHLVGRRQELGRS